MNISSELKKQAVDNMQSEAERFIEKLQELRALQESVYNYGGTYQFKERAAVKRASIDLKRRITSEMKNLYTWE